MKKLSAILLAGLYLTLTSGFAINVNYCMGKVSSFQLDTFHDAFHNAGKKDAGNSCCRTTFKFVKVTASHIAAPDNIQHNPLPVTAFIPGNYAFSFSPLAVIYFSAQLHAPPILPHQSLYLHNCSFLI